MHIDARFKAHEVGFVLCRHYLMESIQPLYIQPVAYNNAFKAHLLAQKIVQQPFISVTRNAVQVVVRRHKGFASCINGLTKRR